MTKINTMQDTGPGRLAGKRALVTGGESGIGRAAVELFVAEGAQVHVVGLDTDLLQSLASDLGPEKVSTARANVADESVLAAAIASGAERWGGYDVVFSNAGIGCAVQPITEYAAEDFRKVLEVHVMGSFHTLKHAAPLLADGGSIIITASTAGLAGYANTAPYVAAKHAQVGLMRTAFKELAPRKIRVNTVNPGPTKTRLQDEIAVASTGAGDASSAAAAIAEGIPLGRYNTPKEVAEAVLYLASDQSRAITGTTLVIDGGFLG